MLPASLGEEYLGGENIYALGRKYGVSAQTILNRLNDLGIKCYRSGGRARASLPAAIADEYARGSSTLDLGAKYGVSWSTIANRLRDLGVILEDRSITAWRSNPTKGKGHSPETRRKLSESAQRQFSRPGVREQIAATQRRVMSEGKAPRVSRLEDEVAGYLSSLGVPYKRQVLIRGAHGQFVACVDFQLSSAVVLEVQGDFWHANPAIYRGGPVHAAQKNTVANDARKHGALSLLGITVAYLWERDVRTQGVRAIQGILHEVQSDLAR